MAPPTLSQSWPRLSILLDSPCKWTPRHLALLHADERNSCSVEAIVGATNVPRDAEKEFERLAGPLCEITEQELADGTRIEHIKDNMFYSPLWDIHEAACLRDKYHLKQAILWLIDIIMSNMKIAGNIELDAMSYIPFALPISGTYNVIRGAVRCCGSIEQRNQGDILSKSLPLLMVSCSSGNQDRSRLINDIPKLLLQLVVAYQKYPSRKSYTAFVMNCQGVSVRVSMARVSNAYMVNLWNADLSDENERFHLFRSEAFDLRYQDGRREALRLIIGILRYLSLPGEPE